MSSNDARPKEESGGGKPGGSDGSNSFAVVNLVSSDEDEEKIGQPDVPGPSARKKRRLMTKSDLHDDKLGPNASLDPMERLNEYSGARSETPSHERPRDNTDRHNAPNPPNNPADAHDPDDELQVVSCVLARTPRSNAASGNPSRSADPPAPSKMGLFSPSDRRDGRNVRRSGRDRAHVGNDSASGSNNRRKASDRNGNTNTTEQLQVVDCVQRVNPLVDYAHFRFQCVTKPFKHRRRQAKLEYCGKCFCYVCDDRVEKCSAWQEHYEAIDSSTHWKTLRDECLHARRKKTVDLSQAGSQFARIQQPVSISLLDSDTEPSSSPTVTDPTTGQPVVPNPDQSGDNDNNDDDDENESIGSLDDMVWYDTDDINDVIRDASSQLEEIRLTPDSFSMVALASLLDANQNPLRSSANRLDPQPYNPAIFD